MAAARRAPAGASATRRAPGGRSGCSERTGYRRGGVVRYAFSLSLRRALPSASPLAAVVLICWTLLDGALALVWFLVWLLCRGAPAMSAAGLASAGGPALAPLPEPPVPWLLVGRRVRHALPAASGAGPHLREGVVIGVHTQPTGATLWRVHYEASGSSATSERDELSWPELSAALVNEAREQWPKAGARLRCRLILCRFGEAPPLKSLARSSASVLLTPRLALLYEARTGEFFPGRGLGRYRACFRGGGERVHLGTFASALEAAFAYDEAVRVRGGLCVNFPRRGTDEIHAVKGEADEITLRRAGRAP